MVSSLEISSTDEKNKWIFQTQSRGGKKGALFLTYKLNVTEHEEKEEEFCSWYILYR